MSLWGNRDSKTASGTISSIDGDGNVVGSGTSFTTQARVGNYIYADDKEFIIVEIIDNTHCTVLSGVHGGVIDVGSSYSYTLSEKPAYVAGAECSDSSGDSGDSSKVYGVDIGEMTAGGDNVVAISVVDGGNKYRENQVVFALSDTNAVGETIINVESGKVESVLMLATGALFSTVPNVYTLGAHYTISTGIVNTTTNVLGYVAHPLEDGDYVRYLRMGGTAITGSIPGTTYSGTGTNNTLWYVRKITPNGFKLYNTLAGATEGNGKTGVIVTGKVSTSLNTFNFANPHDYTTGDEVFYNAGGATKITLSTGNMSETSPYYIVVVDANNIKFATSRANAIATIPVTVDITGTGNSLQYLTTSELDITGTGNSAQRIMLANDGDLHNTAADNRATFVAILGSGDSYDHSRKGATITHAGWVRRTIGTGGRAGRVQYETLVAMSSINGDQADDLQLPDAP